MNCVFVSVSGRRIQPLRERLKKQFPQGEEGERSYRRFLPPVAVRSRHLHSCRRRFRYRHPAVLCPCVRRRRTARPDHYCCPDLSEARPDFVDRPVFCPVLPASPLHTALSRRSLNLRLRWPCCPYLSNEPERPRRRSIRIRFPCLQVRDSPPYPWRESCSWRRGRIYLRQGGFPVRSVHRRRFQRRYPRLFPEGRRW